MSDYEKAMVVMKELFAKDCVFALATSNSDIPSVRMIDTYYENGAFYVVTYASSRKVKEMESNRFVALCYQAYRFDGVAHNIGHPLASENADIRKKLIHVFEPWYFKHNNENDVNMCYVKIELGNGFFYKDGTGYQVDFKEKKVKTFPFTFDIVIPE